MEHSEHTVEHSEHTVEHSEHSEHSEHTVEHSQHTLNTFLNKLRFIKTGSKYTEFTHDLTGPNIDSNT